MSHWNLFVTKKCYESEICNGMNIILDFTNNTTHKQLWIWVGFLYWG